MTLIEIFESHGLLDNQRNILAEDRMKYTNSQDGVERCTVLLEIRLTREEFKEIAALAKAMNRKSVKDYLEYTMLDVERLYNEMEEDKRGLRYKEEDDGKTHFTVRM